MKQIVILSIGLIMLGCTSMNSNSEKESSQHSVICPMCGGSGVSCLMPDDIFAPRTTCSACNGTGMCTEQQAINIQNAVEQANFFMNGGRMNTPQKSGRSVYEIQHDLDKAYRLLADMERQYQECSSVIIAAQYPSMIQKQRERIYRLEAELRNATH